jgi:hypothetical protein
MPARARKFIGMVVILLFLTIYLLTAMAIGLRLPDHWAVRLIYYPIVGTLWGLPLFPLIRWMNRGP